MDAWKEHIAAFTCLAMFATWYLFTGYMMMAWLHVRPIFLLLLLLPLGVIGYFIRKVIVQMKYANRMK